MRNLSNYFSIVASITKSARTEELLGTSIKIIITLIHENHLIQEIKKESSNGGIKSVIL